MTENIPLVSIGLPVYNGEKYLEEAIDSILAQTFKDFELIICDNASTDRTAEICQKFAIQDSRVRYYRNEKNIGGGNNHILTYKLSRGKYFRWAADDDICHQELIEKCVSILETNPAIVLCYPAVMEIDSDGNVLKTTTPNLGLSPSPYIRFRQLADRKHSCEETYGLIRTEVLNKTTVQLQYVNADRVLLAELCLYGPFYQICEALFYKRYHPRNEYLSYRGRMAWYKPDLADGVVFPNWMEFRDHFAIIRRALLPFKVKLQCCAYLFGPWLRQNGKGMLKDICFVSFMLLHSKKYREQFFAKANNWA